MALRRSCLYECDVVHHRVWPLEHRFSYRYFLFLLDLDEISILSSQLYFLSYRRFGFYSFFEQDHTIGGFSSLRESVEGFVRENEVLSPIGRIELVTQLRYLGYVFNPVSFYYCYDPDDQPLCAIAEVSNTFGEKKRYFLGRNEITHAGFEGRKVKHFYVSPFVDLDACFHFRLGMPSDRLTVRIDDYRSEGEIFPFIRTALHAKRLPLTDRILFKQFVRFPFVTFKIITAIHWQALRLYLKGLPYRRKNEDLHLQKGVYRAKG